MEVFGAECEVLDIVEWYILIFDVSHATWRSSLNYSISVLLHADVYGFHGMSYSISNWKIFFHFK